MKKKTMAKGRYITSEMLVNNLYSRIDRTTHVLPQPGLIIATQYFKEPYPLVNETNLLCLAIMDLLILFGYPYPYAVDSYCKFTIIYTIIGTHHEEEISLTIGTAIALTSELDNSLIPLEEIPPHQK
jgi:hypothetical protein